MRRTIVHPGCVVDAPVTHKLNPAGETTLVLCGLWRVKSAKDWKDVTCPACLEAGGKPVIVEPLLRKEGTAIVALACDSCGNSINPGDRAVAEANAPVGGHVDLDWFGDYLTEPQPIRFDLADFQARRAARKG